MSLAQNTPIAGYRKVGADRHGKARLQGKLDLLVLRGRMKGFWLVLIGAVAIEASHGLFIPQLKALPPTPAEWKLVGQTVLKPLSRERPAWSGTSGALKAWRGIYDGAPPITLTLYLLPWSPGSAWDAIQEWRPLPGAMAFAKGNYFGVAASPGAGQGALKRFVQAVTATLPPGSETLR
jgi:hypothetical protein